MSNRRHIFRVAVLTLCLNNLFQDAHLGEVGQVRDWSEDGYSIKREIQARMGTCNQMDI